VAAAHAIAVANDTIYGLNASVFTNDVDRARDVARQLRSGTVGHNAFRTDFGMAKTVILEGRPAGYELPVP
jgi:acyl-CoA reductase-like NAD-dependent aldehyde dehydrogenase